MSLSSDLRDEITDAVYEAASGHMNQIGADHGLRPLSWSAEGELGCSVRSCSGVASIGAYDTDTAKKVVTEWADTFGLDEVDKPAAPGTREWRGTIDDCAVSVWFVADPDAFYPAFDSEPELQPER